MTKEWFELHRDKLLSAASATKQDKDVSYFDPLSRKTFNSESKYNEFTNSNKYKVGSRTDRQTDRHIHTHARTHAHKVFFPWMFRNHPFTGFHPLTVTLFVLCVCRNW